MGVGTTPPKSNFLYVNLIKNVGCEKNWDGRGNSPEIFFFMHTCRDLLYACADLEGVRTSSLLEKYQFHKIHMVKLKIIKRQNTPLENTPSDTPPPPGEKI